MKKGPRYWAEHYAIKEHDSYLHWKGASADMETARMIYHYAWRSAYYAVKADRREQRCLKLRRKK